MLWLALAGVGNAAAATSPEDVACEYMAALREEGIVASVRYMHPDELQRFKAMFQPLFDASDSEAALGLLKVFYGEKATPKSVAALSAEEFLRGFLRVADTQFKALDVTFGDMQVLGSVQEGDVLHLVTRVNAGTPDFSLTQMEVVSMKRHGDDWRVMLSGQVEGFAQAIRGQWLKAGKGG